MVTKRLLLFLTLLVQTVAQDFRTFQLHKIGDMRYQCTDSGCSASSVMRGFSLRRCQLACIDLTNCQTIVFDQSINLCELFLDSIEQRGSMVTQAGIITLVVLDQADASSCKYLMRQLDYSVNIERIDYFQDRRPFCLRISYSSLSSSI